jgi:hypothetical protein
MINVMKPLSYMTDEFFFTGVEIDDYLETLRFYRSLVRSLVREADAPERFVDKLKEAVASRNLRMEEVRASAFSEPWCGDWACNLPILRSFFQKCGIPFRLFSREKAPELHKSYLADGVDHIPVISLWDGQGKELARWVEAPAKVDEMKVRWKEEHPRMMELYAIKDGDREAEKEFGRLYRSFLEEMALWYKEGMWNETLEELVLSLSDGKPL